MQEHSEEKISVEEAHQLYQDSMMLPPGFWIQPGSHFTHDKQPEGNCQDLRWLTQLMYLIYKGSDNIFWIISMLGQNIKGFEVHTS